MMTRQEEIRSAFWMTFYDRKPRRFYSKSQNELPTDVRCAFVDFVDSLACEGSISEAMASRVRCNLTTDEGDRR
jgi:hypothetical protein